MKKRKKFSKVKHVKALSRAALGSVPKGRIVPDKRRKLLLADTRQDTNPGYFS